MRQPNVRIRGIAQHKGIGRGYNRIIYCSSDQSDVLQDLSLLNRRCVGGKDHVLVAHLELRGQKIARWVAEVNIIDNRNNGPFKLGYIYAQPLGNTACLAAIDVHRGWVGKCIIETASFSDRLCQRDPPSIEFDLTLLPLCAECNECLRLTINIYCIVRPSINVIGRLIDQCTKRNRGTSAIPLEHDPRVVALGLRSARARDLIKDFFAGVTCRESTRSIHFAEHTDQGGVLGDERHDRLRFNGPVLECINN